MNPLVQVFTVVGLLILGAVVLFSTFLPWCKRAFDTIMSDEVAPEQMTAAIPPLGWTAKIGLVLFPLIQGAAFIMVCSIEPQNFAVADRLPTMMLATGFTMLFGFLAAGLFIICDIYIFSAEKPAEPTPE